jgi:hypothetical protein
MFPRNQFNKTVFVTRPVHGLFERNGEYCLVTDAVPFFLTVNKTLLTNSP